MKKFLLLSAIIPLFATSCAHDNTVDSEHIYIISTNDMHANINLMPQLASLVEEYEALGEVLVVDSGDRVSGNAFVDDYVEPGVPMIELMNSVGYDVVTLGNHEFDNGHEALNRMMEASDFRYVCANVTPNVEMESIEPYIIIPIGGIDIAFVGVVDTDQNGTPLGDAEKLASFSFTSDINTAFEMADVVASKSDFSVLLSHMGYEVDRLLAERNPTYDWIAGGHSHDTTNTTLNDIQISQNNRDIVYATIADIEVCEGEIRGVEYYQINIEEYAAKQDIAEQVAYIKSLSPELNIIEGHANDFANRDGVANLTIAALANYPYDDGFVPEISIYHYGGIRLPNLPKGDITRGDIYNNDPYKSTIYIGEMSTEQLRTMILDKYNSGSVTSYDKESHYNYFRSDVPYTIIVGDTPAEMPDATDVIFDTLEEGHMYRVAMCSYIQKSYIDKDIAAQQLRPTNISVRNAMLHYLDSLDEGYTPDNTVYQIEKHATNK